MVSAQAVAPGAASARGGGVMVQAGTLTMTDSIITNTTASGNNSAGGGMLVQAGTLSMTNSTITNATARQPPTHHHHHHSQGCIYGCDCCSPTPLSASSITVALQP